MGHEKEATSWCGVCVSQGSFTASNRTNSDYHSGNKYISRIVGSSNRYASLKKGQEPGQPHNSIRAMNGHQQVLFVFSIFVILYSRFKIPGKKVKVSV